MVKAAQLVDVPKKNSVAFPMSVLLAPLDAAEALNNANADRRPAVRRVLCKQGRISRRIIEAAEVLENMLQFLTSSGERENLYHARQELDVAKVLLHLPHSTFLKRPRRPQAQVNEHLCAALSHFGSFVLDARPAPQDADGAKLVEDIRWHVREAAYQTSLWASLKPLPRRLKTNQYEINRCQIISIRLMARLITG